MDAMTILRRCRRFGDENDALCERIERRRALAERMTAAYGREGGSRSGGDSDRMTQFVIDLETLEAQLGHRKERYDAERMAAAVMLDALDQKGARIIQMYYIEGYKLAAIADKMGYTEQHTRRLRRGCEEKLAQMTADEALPGWYLDEEIEK